MLNINLDEYATNFIKNPNYINSELDDLSCIPNLNTVLDINDNGTLLASICMAYLLNINQEFLYFIPTVSSPKFGF